MKIPKNPNQAINGLGVSIMALVMLLLFLPIATVGMMEISQYLEGDYDGNYHNWNNGSPLDTPPSYPENVTLFSQQGHTGTDTYYSSRWLNSGSHGACTESGDRSHTFGSVITSSSTYGSPPIAFDSCRYPHSTAEFASEYWSLMTTCGETQAVNPDCGDDRFSLAISDYFMDYTQTITEFKYQALGEQLGFECNDISNIGYIGNLSFDYTISIQVWLPNSGGTFLIVLEYLPDLWSGVMTVRNYVDDIAQGHCLISLEINHILSISEQLQYSQFNFAQYEQPHGDPIISFIIDIDNMYDEDNSIPKSMSNIATPFEQYSSGEPFATMHFFQRFEVGEISPHSITTASTVVTSGIGVVLWVGAIASTPAWSPLARKIKEARK